MSVDIHRSALSIAPARSHESPLSSSWTWKLGQVEPSRTLNLVSWHLHTWASSNTLCLFVSIMVSSCWASGSSLPKSSDLSSSFLSINYHWFVLFFSLLLSCYTPNCATNKNAEVVRIKCVFVTTLKFPYRKILFLTLFILSTKLKTQRWLT